jgi:DNA-directed RNA polymerase specialized sigma24 family protein
MFYEIVWKYVRDNHAKLAARVARYLRVEGIGNAEILPGEIDEVAHEATQIALRRVRSKAARFDPGKGTPTQWVIGAAEYAYIEVAKRIVRERRSRTLVFVDPESLIDEPDPNSTPEEQVLRQLQDAEALTDAAKHLTEKEFAAVRLVETAGYSYTEVAKVIFGDESMTKQVDGLLTRGKRKLAKAWAEKQGSLGTAGSITMFHRTRNEEGAHE